jgi:hypothetical protein
MKIFTSFIVVAFLVSCTSQQSDEKEQGNELPIQGTWLLLSGTLVEKGDTVITDYTRGQRMIKIINATHFSFLRHDLTKGNDTAIYSSGGGSYTLTGDQYTENLEYCTDRQWEGNSFPFTVSIRNDTLVQQGVEKIENLGIERLNIEKYIRVKN